MTSNFNIPNSSSTVIIIIVATAPLLRLKENRLRKAPWLINTVCNKQPLHKVAEAVSLKASSDAVAEVLWGDLLLFCLFSLMAAEAAAVELAVVMMDRWI